MKPAETKHGEVAQSVDARQDSDAMTFTDTDLTDGWGQGSLSYEPCMFERVQEVYHVSLMMLWEAATFSKERKFRLW